MTVSHSPAKFGRRRFLFGLASFAACAAASAGGVGAVEWVRSHDSPARDTGQWLNLGPLSDLKPGLPNGFPFSRHVDDAQAPHVQTGVAYAITHDSQNVRVFSNICTHQGCRVNWHAEEGHFVCPCHEAVFDADGRVLAGPATRPLDAFAVRIESGQIEILLEV